MAFKRMEGFAGSVPQKFIDNKLTKCPMCGTTNPHWAIDQKMGLVSLSRYLFQCDECKCILSSTVADVTGFANTPFTTLGIAKALGGKRMRTIYMRIDDVGQMQTTQIHLGKEIGLDELIEMAGQL